MTATQATIYTIPAGIAFADTLARGLMEQTGGNPTRLAAMRLFLPTRRACRNVREAFLRLSEGKPLLLPRMQPLGDIDEDKLGLELAGHENAELLLDLPPTIAPVKRQILLARTILKLPDFSRGPDQAFQLAGALGRLMDQIHTEGLDISDLAHIVPAEFAHHWEITLDFLKILSETWPAILAEQGVMEASARRTHLMKALVAHWQTNPPRGPVIAAGSTGSIPATAELLKTIAHLPQGAIILPGLDQGMEDESWNALDDTHPQATLKQLLARLSIPRETVKLWPYQPPSSPREDTTQKARQWLASEMMRPAATAGRWQNITLTPEQKDRLERSLDHVMRFDCENPEEEANLIALLLRETLEDSADKTAALVTSDRTLARRVAMACRRWGIEIDDSGGQTLNDSAHGGFLRLIMQTALDDLRPAFFLSLIKHHFYTNPQEPQIIEAIEQALFRGPAPHGGFETLTKHAAGNDKILSFLDLLEQKFTPLLSLCDGQTHPFNTVLDAHLTLAETLAGADRLWQGETGEEAARFFADLRTHAAHMTPVTAQDYTAIMTQLMRGQIIRPAYGTHPRLSILGQLEARLLQADRVILGGLNEGTWPPEPATDPWMSRPMKQAFGLPAPERAIGLAAHDFVQGFCAPHVVLTRSRRADGTPTVPARWLQRLDTVLHAATIDPKKLTAHPYLHYVRKLDEPENVAPCARPAPTPPLSARPRQLFVTAIERWMRDPYSLYARYILNLRKLDPIEQEADAALRGSLIHNVLDHFIREYPDISPDNALEILLNQGRTIIAEKYNGDPALSGLWWSRFEQIARWFVVHEKTWRTQNRPLATESEGTLHLPELNFTLKAKADRIDQQIQTNTIALIDYKTGATPSKPEIESGNAPQMALEAFILSENGFSALPPALNTVDYIGFWKLDGQGEGGSEKPVKITDIDALIATTRQGLISLISAFDQEDTPYYSLPRPDKAPPAAQQDYAHLARVQEWAALGDEEGAEI